MRHFIRSFARRRRAAALRSAMAAVLCATAISADYSPLQIGRTWVYSGAGVRIPEPLVSAGGRLQVIRYRETLRLTVTETRNRRGATVYTVEERDSLFERKLAWWNSVPPGDSAPLADTVLIRSLTYVQDTAMRLENGDSLGLGHHGAPDPFFPTLSAAPTGATALNGLTAPYQGVQANLTYRRQDGSTAWGTAWYLDGMGLYWMRLGATLGMCDGPERRELLLQSMDGRPVEAGLAPPGSALAKEGRVACGLRRPRRAGRTGTFGFGGAGEGIDAMGRRLAAPAEGALSHPP